MKYYTLKYTTSIRDGFGAEADMWRIKILEKYKGDNGLLEHEKFHVREWWAWMLTTIMLALFLIPTFPLAYVLFAISPFTFKVLYRAKWYRKWSEVLAYRKQLVTGYNKNTPYSSNSFAVKALMNKYGLGLSEKEARKLLEW